MKKRNRTIATSLLAVLLLLALFLGCSTNSPTAPQQDDEGGGGLISGRWQITATTTPSIIRAGGEVSTIRATIVNRDSGEAPPDGSATVITTDLGLLGDPVAGANAVVVPTDRGKAEVDLYSGNEEGTADLVISFGNATLRKQVKIRDAVFLFLESISPSQGPESGGYSAAINGTGFNAPVRVTFGSGQGFAEVRSVTSNRIVVTVPPYNGSLNSGEVAPATDVTVALCTAGTDGTADCGATDTLPMAFTYIADEDAE